MISKNSIGVFDSGVGGISILKELIQLLPNENTIYLADSKNAPYGERSKQEIIDLSIKNTEYLLSRNCKIIVVACNTATTNAIDYLRSNYNVPFIGIEPAIKPAALQTKTNAIGILATKGTLSSDLFHSTSQKFTEGITVIETIGEGLVPLIENNQIESLEMEQLLQKFLRPMLQKKIDYLVLGCSHYPFLIPQIKKIVGKNVTIIDSGEAVARQTKTILDKNNLLNISKKVPQHNLYSNADVKTLTHIVEGVTDTAHIAYLNF
ncbi:glutamate racemase [Aureibaculum sp. 2210JD6-5]|uniref:glutamate racemase n=1 Tax=Aureibaculum sp. 2210JD6-5 TaxID=3103957 RepID=UPI002AAE8737|nr:glutamate racemase [Aureibaculum sp. 2210JD6-5]MDY7396252.1 glutamate racemase [Aureibaculum sp. 2210JD6-5]